MACERFALSIGAVVALLTACAGNGAVNMPAVLGAGTAFSHHQTFKYTGASQTFSVPSGVTAVKIVALGGNGATVAGALGGYGGRVTATVSVTPQEQLIVYVGGNGSKTTGGFNGGGSGGDGTYKFSKFGVGGGGAGGDYSGAFGGKAPDSSAEAVARAAPTFAAAPDKAARKGRWKRRPWRS